MVGVMSQDGVRNAEIRTSAGIEETHAEKWNRKMLRWFGHVESLDQRYWQRKVRVATVEGHQGIGRPKFGLLDGVKRALAVKEMGFQEATKLNRKKIMWREHVRA